MEAFAAAVIFGDALALKFHFWSSAHLRIIHAQVMVEWDRKRVMWLRRRAQRAGVIYAMPAALGAFFTPKFVFRTST